MTFRAISSVAKCSHGSVWAERKAMKKEEDELKQKLAAQVAEEMKLKEASVVFPEIQGSELKAS